MRVIELLIHILNIMPMYLIITIYTMLELQIIMVIILSSSCYIYQFFYVLLPVIKSVNILREIHVKYEEFYY